MPPAAVPSTPSPLRILVNPLSQWGAVRDTAADTAGLRRLEMRRAELAYYKSLGFTHSSYGLDQDRFNHYRKVRGKWTFMDAGGRTDSSLAAAKREAERQGLRLLPQLASLSHMEPYIVWVDPSMSEFPDPAAFLKFLAEKGYPADRNFNHVAAVGDNPAADQFFEAELEIIRRAWAGGKEKAPDHIIIGHDELGHDSVCFIKAGRSSGNPATRSELVAAEIDRRVGQVERTLGPSVRVLLYGDSFLPTDLGERYGLTGDPETGKGGVLWLLRYRYGLHRKILIMPWNYLLEDGDKHYWSRYAYSKGRQIALLDRLGFGFIPGLGEMGSNGDVKLNRSAPPFALGLRDKTVSCMLEWVSAARAHPRMLRGYAHQVYEPFDYCAPDGLCAGFTAPILAYAGWIHPEGKPAGRLLPPPQALKQVDYRRSRKERKWTPGVHYPKQ